MTLLLTVAIYITVVWVESTVARIYGHFPVLCAMFIPFALLICAADINDGSYWSGAGAMFIAVACAAGIADSRRATE